MVPIISEYNLPHDIENFILKNRVEALENAFVKKFMKETGIPENKVTQLIEYGFVPEKIVTIAAELKIEMIIMGAKGVSDRFESWIGTNAQNVVKKAECPVLIVSQNTFMHYPKTILYAADFESDEILATEKLLKITKELDLKPSLVHICDKLELNIGHQTEAMANYLEDKFQADNLNVEIIKNSNKIIGLEKYLVATKPDLLAIAIHEKSFLEQLFLPSTIKHFVQESTVSILCFRK